MSLFGSASSLHDLAASLGTPTFVPSNRSMGKVSNKVCICWDTKNTSLNNIVVNVGVGLKVILLPLGTFFGACFKCNGFGHFVRECPSNVKATINPPIASALETLDSMVEGESIKSDKVGLMEKRATPDKILKKPSPSWTAPLASTMEIHKDNEALSRTIEALPRCNFAIAIS